jgi:type 1 glutamine amidotransferase
MVRVVDQEERTMKFSGLKTSAALAALALGATGGTVLASGGLGNTGGTSPNGVTKAIYTDGITDYGVNRGTDPSIYNDWGNGWREGGTPRVIIYSHTPGPRHAHLGPSLAPGLNPPLTEANVAQWNLKKWLEAEGVQVDWTEDPSALNRLNNYNGFIALSANRDAYDDTAQTSLKQFVRRGGGFIGIHNAFGAEYNWPWYEGLLGGANFYDHGPNRDGTVEVLNKKDVSTKGLPTKWEYKDEWYNLVPFPSYVNFLAKVDAKTSDTGRATGHPGHGDNHPVSWCHYYDGGKSWLTTLGHDSGTWRDADFVGQKHFQKHVVNGVLSAIGKKEFCQS